MVFQDRGDGEEKISLSLILKSVLLSEAVLLGDAGDAEGLAGESAAQNIEEWDVLDRNGGDVAIGFFAEVRGVGLLGKLVPVARKDALGSGAFKGDSESTYATEEVDEPKRPHGLRFIGACVFREEPGCGSGRMRAD